MQIVLWLVFNRSDGRVVRASASESVDLGFDFESGQTNDLKIDVHSFPAWRSTFKGQCGESRQVHLLCRWERHLARFPHLGVVDRWPATPKRARYSALIAFS